jgi:hypothetical protein
MRKIALFAFSFLAFFSHLRADGFSEAKMNLDETYQTGCAAHEGATTSINASVFGWGIGLAAGIAILTGILHQSKGNAH